MKKPAVVSLPAPFRHLAGLALLLAQPLSAAEFHFDFGPGEVADGFRQVTSASAYSKETGFGFLPGADLEEIDSGGANAGKRDACASNKPFLFAIDAPEGNYQVRLLLGDPKGRSDTTVKFGSRQLMLEQVTTADGELVVREFTANVRTPDLPDGRKVGLKPRESGVNRWQDRLTFEFNGPRPAVAALDIVPAPEAVTVFLAGDSTVTDQSAEPWAGWGQMLPSFFKPGTAVANHAESGLALFSFRGQRRLDKVLSQMKPGDFLLIQFGHNDQKDKSPGSGPFTSYKENLRSFVVETRKKEGIPVLVTPMERRRWKGREPQQTLTDFAEAVRQVGKEEDVPVIDLHAMSLRLYGALGPEKSKRAFVHYPANTYPGQDQRLKDDTHHNSFGGYQLARCIVEGIRGEVPELAKLLRDDLPAYDPDHPDDPDEFALPASPDAVVEKPDGN